MDKTIRLALVGGAASHHGRSFPYLINGVADGAELPQGWPKYAERVEGARVVTVWDDDRAAAESLAAAFGIDGVAATMESAAEGIDGVIITDDGSLRHQQRARHFLECGLPTFIDKPLSADVAEAEAIVELAAKHNAPLMSCSALRYAVETEAIRSEPDKLGEIQVATSICGGELVYYGIHALELGYSVMGPGVRSVHNVGAPDRHIVKLAYPDGRSLIVMVFEQVSYVFHLNLYGTKGREDIVVREGGRFYANTLQQVVEMARTRRAPFAVSQTLEIIRILNAARQSLHEGREIVL